MRQYFHDQGSVAYTKDNGSISSANIRSLDGSIISSARGSSSYLYTEDIQGSTGTILDSSFQSRNTYDYTDFGEVMVSGTSQIENEICYTGAVYDETTGLHYLNARYYDPENGRFISQDSYRGELDDYAQWHLYAYCVNNPINYTDPSGHGRQGSNEGTWEYDKFMYSIAFKDLWDVAEAYRTGEKSFKEIIAIASIGFTIAGIFVYPTAMAIAGIVLTVSSYNSGVKSLKYYQKCYNFYKKKKNKYKETKEIYITQKFKRLVRKNHPRTNSDWKMYNIILSGKKPEGF